MKNKKILITTSSFNLQNFKEHEILRSLGFQIILNPYGKKMNENQILDLIDQNVIAMIAGTEPLNALVFEKASSLKIIVRCGIGMDNVDLSAAKKKGIIVTNTPDAPTRAVAELVIGHLLSLLRKISYDDRQIRAGNWKKPMGSLFYGKKIGIIGAGRIGKMVANLSSSFGAKVLAYDSFVKESNDFFSIVSLEKLLKESDIISLHIPYNNENHHFIDSEAIELMKEGVIILNISRGGLIDENALYNAVKSGKVCGACIDCFEEEPYLGKLKDLDEVQLTSHVGSYAKESRIQQEIDSCVKLISLMKKIKLYE
jgi:D-3-phosphoglycerate dehydrogenase / 2-oxoglutarate reductase